MNELKLVVENDAENASPARPETSTLNPFDALNRRDIELIKKSLVNMHRDSVDLRTTMIALHERNCRAPSKSFVFGIALMWLIGLGALTVARPRLDSALRHIPIFARLIQSTG